MKTDPKIQKLAFSVPIIIILGLTSYWYITKDQISPRERNDLAEQFNGNVDSLFRDRWEHNVEKAILNNNYVYSLPPDWENIIEIGDSLSKKKNTLRLEVFRKGNPKLVLDYRDTYKKEED